MEFIDRRILDELSQLIFDERDFKELVCALQN